MAEQSHDALSKEGRTMNPVAMTLVARCGIPASVMTRLGTIGVITRADGMGLGLSLALQTISRHEGVIHVESCGG
jgi:nitrogen-specific signal transduction histidine kinase